MSSFYFGPNKPGSTFVLDLVANMKEAGKLFLVLIVLIGAVLKSTTCGDVHRIVLKTFYLTSKDKDHHKHYPHHHAVRKPVYHESFEENWSREQDHYYDYHPTHKHSRSPKPPPEKPHFIKIEDAVDFTTSSPEKFHLRAPPKSSRERPHHNSVEEQDIGKTRTLREKDKQLKGYEVYEEILGDLLPPPPPKIMLRNLQKINTTTRSQNEDENYLSVAETTTRVQQEVQKQERPRARRTRGRYRFNI